MAVTMMPLVLGLLHITDVKPVPVLERLNHIIDDARLRATMPNTRDERIVIFDIDEKSLSRLGKWPCGRDKLAGLARELFERQQAAELGFNVVFAESDSSSGLGHWSSWQVAR